MPMLWGISSVAEEIILVSLDDSEPALSYRLAHNDDPGR